MFVPRSNARCHRAVFPQRRPDVAWRFELRPSEARGLKARYARSDAAWNAATIAGPPGMSSPDPEDFIEW